MNINININIDDRYVKFFKRALKSKKVQIQLITLSIGIPFALHAAPITKPNTFTANTVASAAQVNANFDTLYTKVNDNDARLTTLESRVGGIASVTNSSCSIGTAITDCLSITVTLKSTGYVHLSANGLIQLYNDGLAYSDCRPGLATSSAGVMQSSTRLFYAGGAVNAAYYEVPYGVHHVAGPYTAGTYSFYLVASRSAACTLYNNRLTAQFFPTAI